MDYINAFWVGGVICALTQILMEKTKMLPGRIMVLLVCSSGSGRDLSAFDRLCRRGSQRAAAWFWKYALERNPGSCG